MINIFPKIFQGILNKTIRAIAPIGPAPDTTTAPPVITVSSTTFTITAPPLTTDPSITTLFSCGSGVRHSSTYTISSSGNYAWVKGPWIAPGCWVHFQASGFINCSLGSGITGNVYPEGYYGNTVLGLSDPASTHTIAEPWKTQKEYPNTNFLSNRLRPFCLISSLGNYLWETGNEGAVVIPRNLFISWDQLKQLTDDLVIDTQGGYLWFGLNHNSSGLSGSITLKIDIYYECNPVNVPVTTTGSTSSTSSTSTSSTSTSSTTVTDTTPSVSDREANEIWAL